MIIWLRGLKGQLSSEGIDLALEEDLKTDFLFIFLLLCIETITANRDRFSRGPFKLLPLQP